MMKKIFKAAGYLLLIIFTGVLTRILWPQHYDVPKLVKRSGTQFWDLSTGSRIGYTLVPGMGLQKNVSIIYLHGGPGGAVSDRDINELSLLAKDGFNIYFYDQVGSGLSSRLNNIREYSVDRHLKDLLEIVHLIGSEKVIIVGQSWGAILAVLFTAQHPEKVGKLILTSPGPIYPFEKELLTVRLPDSILLRAPYYSNQEGNRKANTLRTKAMAYCAKAFGKKLASDEEADDFSTYLNSLVNRSVVCDTGKILPARAGGGYYSQVMTFKSLTMVKDQRTQIGNIKSPVLVMKGQCDNQPWGVTNEYLQLIRHSQLKLIPGAGHFIAVEQPLLYFNTIREFLLSN